MVAVSVVLALLLAAAAPASADIYSEGRQRVTLTIPGGTYSLLLPRLQPVSPSGDLFRRTYHDTCGLFDVLHVAAGAKGTGPPPHVHYADDEWFLQVGEGSVRMFSAQRETTYLAGQLPGHNAPAPKMGSALIGRGQATQALYSPKGNVHYYTRETNVTDFFAIHASGYAMPLLLNADFTITNATELLYYTGLYGAPHGATGAMVGAPDYLAERGPVDPATLMRTREGLVKLQALFDAAEACNPGGNRKQQQGGAAGSKP